MDLAAPSGPGCADRRRGRHVSGTRRGTRRRRRWSRAIFSQRNPRRRGEPARFVHPGRVVESVQVGDVLDRRRQQRVPPGAGQGWAFGQHRAFRFAVQSVESPRQIVNHEPMSRLRNSWGLLLLGAVLNSPGERPLALDRRLDACSGRMAARREVEVELFRRVCRPSAGTGVGADARRAPRDVAGGALTRSPGVRAGRRVSASTPNMQWHITFAAPRTRTWRPPNSSLRRPLTRSPAVRSL